jgi:hypothetical protein
MDSRNGKIIAIPCWKIREWIQGGIFALGGGKANQGEYMAGYAFVDEAAGQEQYAAWLADGKRKEAKAAFDAGTPRAVDAGFAEAHLRRAHEPIFDQPPPPPVAEESTEKPQKGTREKPKDVI